MYLLNIHRNTTSLYLFFNLTEVETAALKIFCVMIQSLVYTCREFGLFRVVRPYIEMYM